MGKFGFVFTIIIITAVFLFAMGLVSSQNACTGLRAYTCTSSQKQAAPSITLPQQAAAPTVNTRTRAS